MSPAQQSALLLYSTRLTVGGGTLHRFGAVDDLVAWVKANRDSILDGLLTFDSGESISISALLGNGAGGDTKMGVHSAKKAGDAWVGPVG